MEVTHRYWAGGILACLLAGSAWLFVQPLVLVGAASIGVLLLVHQYRFTRAVLAVAEDVTITQTVSHDRVLTDESTQVLIQADVPEPVPVDLSIEARPPVTATVATDADGSGSLAHGEHEATTALTLDWPIAGQFEIESPLVTITDPAGLFKTQVSVGSPVTVTVVPRRPRELHVGAGGNRLPSAFGEHKTERRGLGLDPADVRQYVPGDTARQIDWKATARTGSTHVREFDAETDLSTALIVDHRSSMATGPQGETKLDYTRQVALAYVGHAQANSEPLAFCAVGDGGVTNYMPPEMSMRHYTTVETHVHDLIPTPQSTSESTTHRHRSRTPGEARTIATRLRSDPSAFGETLHPYFENTQQYVHHIEDDPLFATVQTSLGRLQGAVVTVLLTDDSHPTELLETVRVATRYSDHVLVFLTPTVLFEPGSLQTIETAYDRYVEFEEFRRSLTRINDVTAFEVAPADRIDALLAATQRSDPTGGEH